MNWITNHPKSIKGMWPRRAGVEYFEGEPKATEAYTVEQLTEQGNIGVYIKMDEVEYRKLPLVKNPKELQEALK